LRLNIAEVRNEHFLSTKMLFSSRVRTPLKCEKEAEKLALEESVTDETVTLGGRRARLVFLGVRKIVECQDSTERAIKYPPKIFRPERELRSAILCPPSLVRGI
jgi:hypothetical protein